MRTPPRVTKRTEKEEEGELEGLWLRHKEGMEIVGDEKLRKKLRDGWIDQGLCRSKAKRMERKKGTIVAMAVCLSVSVRSGKRHSQVFEKKRHIQQLPRFRKARRRTVFTETVLLSFLSFLSYLLLYFLHAYLLTYSFPTFSLYHLLL